MAIKKDDTIIVLTGKDKGKTGKVIKSMPKEHKLIVAGINVMKKHQKPRKEGQKGQTVEKAMPIDVSNVALESEHKNKPAKKTVVKKAEKVEKPLKTPKAAKPVKKTAK